MQSELKRIEAVRYEANQILAEGAVRRLPLTLAALAIRGLFHKEGLPQPDDPLAFASGGKINMTMVDGWSSPQGG